MKCSETKETFDTIQSEIVCYTEITEEENKKLQEKGQPIQDEWVDLIDIKKFHSLTKRKKFKGGFSFKNIDVINFGNLEEIDYLSIENACEVNFAKLKRINGYVTLKNIKDVRFNRLRYIGGNFSLANMYLKTLNKLEIIGGFLDCKDAHIENLGMLKWVGNIYNYVIEIKPSMNLQVLTALQNMMPGPSYSYYDGRGNLYID